MALLATVPLQRVVPRTHRAAHVNRNISLTRASFVRKTENVAPPLFQGVSKNMVGSTHAHLSRRSIDLSLSASAVDSVLTEPVYEEFTKWREEKNIKSPRIEIAEFAGGVRGTVALEGRNDVLYSGQSTIPT